VKLIEQIQAEVEYLPPMPVALQKTLQAIGAPDVSAQKLYEIIRGDTALSTDVLKLCNSSYFGLSRRISSLKEAIIFVGLEELKKMVALISSRLMFNRDYGGYESRHGEMWMHAAVTSVISSRLQPLAPEMEEDLFTTALLHDVGKIVLSRFVGERYDEIVTRVRETGQTFQEVEQQVFGTDHADVGGAILNKWSFPEEVVNAVKFHHHPEEVPHSPLTHFVTLADTLAKMLGFGTALDALAYRSHALLYAKYGLKEKDMERVMRDSLDLIRDMEKLYA
jgi:putative nucleotidyltransferase with HDIG domain